MNSNNVWEAILQSSAELRQNVDKERKAMLTFWKKQEKAIDQMTFSITDFVGSIDAISGNTLGSIHGLELPESIEFAQNMEL